jgi:tetratricopeptide (TPR) repeat protein
MRLLGLILIISLSLTGRALADPAGPDPARDEQVDGATADIVGDYDAAIAHFTKAIALGHGAKELSQSYNARCIAYRHKGAYDEAIADCNRAIEIDPNYALAYADRGEAFLAKGLSIAALADLNKALDLNPKHDIAMVTRGEVYEALGDRDKAIADYRGTLALLAGWNPKINPIVRAKAGLERLGAAP